MTESYAGSIAVQKRGSGTALAEAEDELRVVGHLLRRPRRVERQLAGDRLDARDLVEDAVDVLLDHLPGGAAHRGKRVRDLDVRAFELRVVEQAQLDDVHPELGVLHLAERLDDLFAAWHRTTLAEPNLFSPLAGEEVDAVDAPHPVAARAHDDRVRPSRVCEEPHAAEEVAV